MTPANVVPFPQVFGAVVNKGTDTTSTQITSVLSGWPSHLDHSLAWHGSDFGTDEEYIHRFDDAEKSEIEDALAHFKSNDTLRKESLLSVWS